MIALAFRITRGWLFAALVCGTAIAWPAGAQSNAAVRADLVIPAAETHVIGDAIPLYFRFENRSPAPLAFMWEGCCRFNGKLTVTKDGRVIPPTPPGQALAHMFAKAERIEPGQPRDFDTRLSDWVILRESGSYELRGHYQGVLPFQNPQVQRGLALWRDTAETPPLRVSVVSVPDYLAQRDRRSTQRGLKLELTGPAKLPPLQPAPLQVRISNVSPTAQPLVWPEDAQLWLVNSDQVRVASAALIEAPREELTLAPGATIERSVPFGSHQLEGEPWGGYRAFIDLAATADGKPRVPSNPVSVQWELSGDAVGELLAQAAGGHRTGARNAPLKLLRVYVAEILPALSALKLAALPPATATLASQLRAAGCLKPLSPKPGHVEIEARVAAGGAWEFNAPSLVACLGTAPAPVQLASLLAVRRHLGWEVGIVLKPDAAAPLSAIRSVTRELADSRADLASEPRAVIAVGTNRVTTIDFPTDPTPANLVIRLAPGRTEFLRRLPDPQMPARNLIQPAELPAGNYAVLDDASALRALLEDGKLATPQVLVLASGRLTWGELLQRLDPLVAKGLALDVAIGD